RNEGGRVWRDPSLMSCESRGDLKCNWLDRRLLWQQAVMITDIMNAEISPSKDDLGAEFVR
ncbi:MAG: hypothetical protein ACE5R6_21415, partial [Candidatus Heimdallarchaeota archaeon]